MISSPPTSSLNKQIEKTIEEVIQFSPLASAHCGIQINDLETGQSIFERNNHKLFIPASLVKLYTAAISLDHLGPNFSFITSVFYQGNLEKNGSLNGSLILKGGGDPTLDSNGLKQLAEQLYQQGLRKIEGNILVDDDYLQSTQLFAHAEWEDFGCDYVPEISAMSIEDNCVTLTIIPTQHNEPANISIDQKAPYCQIINQLITLDTPQPNPESIFRKETNKNSWKIQRRFENNTITVSGFIPIWEEPIQEKVAINNPKEYARRIFVKCLKETGIVINEKNSSPSVQQKNLKLLTTIKSAPLSDIIIKMNKESQNLTAELLLRVIGRTVNPDGNSYLDQGLKKLDDFIKINSIHSSQYILHDGLGLSRHNLLSPNQIVSLLQYIYRSSHHKILCASLPIAGVDGTLEDRFKDTKAEGFVFAKTGSMSDISNLAGFATLPGKRKIAFCICFNQHLLTSKACSEFVDHLVLEFASQN
ncbi:MAG: D-alanyl-D-alanine carboxypeptidase/D-alanyl-D-alanine-endopeptidase [Parachlamydiaceae bacterium]|nr:D-alanyl-D-alanine carboxypeptidase/D-alanyl-D-alanine-endopeptidase [Parachlamydiaceae bacterium]